MATLAFFEGRAMHIYTNYDKNKIFFFFENLKFQVTVSCL